MELLERLFAVRQRGSTPAREVLGGATTFMALSYIIFVQPAIMASAGVPIGGAFFATCVASAAACFLMALTANYPIALAPAMGHNAWFTYVVVLKLGLSWQQAMAAVFLDGCLFIALSFVGFRTRLMEFIPDSLKRAIAGGIGLLITFVGLEYAGIVIGSPATGVTFGDIRYGPTLLSLFGLALTLAMLALEVRGAVLFGILGTALAGVAATMFGAKLLDLKLTGLPPMDPRTTFFALDFKGLLAVKGAVTIILTFLFLDVFDTVGTLVGVAERGGFLDERGQLPRAQWAFFSDACGTVIGSALGTSTITSYVESAAGVQAGARTGLANVVTGLLLVASMLLYPVLHVVATPHVYASGGVSITGFPVLAPALIVVGSMMLKSLARLNWEDATEFLPAFLTVIIMPLALSITEGIAFGFISYSLLKLVTGRLRDAHWGFHLVSVILLLRYAVL